jgi:hypothetical protein
MLSPKMLAAQQGRTTYDGPPCKRCGNTLRHVLNSCCVPCANEKSKQYQKRRRAQLQAVIKAAREAQQ